jgi:hypothetical protein
MHGGAPGSGAPKGNQNALKHGRFTRGALERRRHLRKKFGSGYFGEGVISVTPERSEILLLRKGSTRASRRNRGKNVDFAIYAENSFRVPQAKIRDTVFTAARTLDLFIRIGLGMAPKCLGYASSPFEVL